MKFQKTMLRRDAANSRQPNLSAVVARRLSFSPTSPPPVAAVAGEYPMETCQVDLRLRHQGRQLLHPSTG